MSVEVSQVQMDQARSQFTEKTAPQPHTHLDIISKSCHSTSATRTKMGSMSLENICLSRISKSRTLVECPAPRLLISIFSSTEHTGSTPSSRSRFAYLKTSSQARLFLCLEL